MIKEALEYINRTNRKIHALDTVAGIDRWLDYDGRLVADRSPALNAEAPNRADGWRILHDLTDLNLLASTLGGSPRGYADIPNRTIQVVLNDDVDSESPQWRDSGLSYTFNQSTASKLINPYLNEMYEQVAFIDLIEKITPYVIDPDPAHMLEVASSLQAVRQANMSNAVRTSDGNIRMQWVEETTGTAGATGDLEIPQKILISYPVFEHLPDTQITLQFRWRPQRGGGLTMGLYAPTLPVILDQVVRDVCERFVEDADFQVVYGRVPEENRVFIG